MIMAMETLALCALRYLLARRGGTHEGRSRHFRAVLGIWHNGGSLVPSVVLVTNRKHNQPQCFWGAAV
jgi:hypothetical protein